MGTLLFHFSAVSAMAECVAGSYHQASGAFCVAMAVFPLIGQCHPVKA